MQGPNIAIQQDAEVLASMNAWCVEHHGASGLTQRCLESTTGMVEAEQQVFPDRAMMHYARSACCVLSAASVHEEAWHEMRVRIGRYWSLCGCTQTLPRRNWQATRSTWTWLFFEYTCPSLQHIYITA